MGQNALTALATFLPTKEDVLPFVLLEATQPQKKPASNVGMVTIGMEPNVENCALKDNTSILPQMSVNAQQANLGQEKFVWLVPVENNLEMIPRLVNAQPALDGTDLAAQKQILAQMAENGMFLLLLVNVLLEQSGMELSASSHKTVEEVNISMKITDAFALKTHT